MVRAEECAEFEALCGEMAECVAGLFEKKRPQLERAFDKSNIAERGWTFSDMTQYLYAAVQPGVLPARKEHENGAERVFWAEEPKTDADK